MVIRELSTDPPYKHITVTLNYDEIRDMANGLYFVCKDNSEYKAIHDKCKFLFDMVKHGMIQPDTVNSMSGATDEMIQPDTVSNMSEDTKGKE